MNSKYTWLPMMILGAALAGAMLARLGGRALVPEAAVRPAQAGRTPAKAADPSRGGGGEALVAPAPEGSAKRDSTPATEVGPLAEKIRARLVESSGAAGDQELLLLLKELGRLDAKTALEILGQANLDRDRSQSLVDAALSGWILADREAAFSWAVGSMSGSGVDANKRMNALVKSLLQEDDFSAARELVGRAAGPTGSEGGVELARAMARMDPEGLIEWIAGMPATSNMRFNAVVGMQQQFAEEAPDLAAQQLRAAVLDSRRGDINPMLIGAITYYNSSGNPAMSLDWIRQVAGSNSEGQFDQLIGSYLRFNGGLPFLDGGPKVQGVLDLMTPASRSAAVLGLSRTVPAPTAISLIRHYITPADQSAALVPIFQKWGKADANAALAYLGRDSSLAADQRELLQAAIGQGAK